MKYSKASLRQVKTAIVGLDRGSVISVKDDPRELTDEIDKEEEDGSDEEMMHPDESDDEFWSHEDLDDE